MAKITRTYFELVDQRPKAVRIRLNEGDRNAVWFPRHRIDLNTEARTVAATQKLWDEKDADAQRDFKAENQEKAARQREYNNEMLPLEGAVEHEGGRAIVCPGHVAEEVTEQERDRTFYFPKSQCRLEDGVWHAPRWLVNAKAIETVYNWISQRGSRRVEGMRGMAPSAVVGGHFIMVFHKDLMKQQEKERG